jgi:hypothetical protein
VARFAGGGPAGALPWIVLSVAAGVMAASVADALARSGHSGGLPLFWLALALMMVPAVARLASSGPRAGERVATVLVVGLGLYAVKVLRDPFTFTYGDELLHLPNLQAILSSGRLFGTNAILPISPRYPGLETAAALIVRLGGMSDFSAGLVLIAVARSVMVVALYLFYERVSGSSRIAGLGALIYAATPTFLFFGAMFAYESLALPLATLALLALVRWAQADDRAARLRWGAVLTALAATVIVTHHVSSYFLVLFMIALCLAHVALRQRRSAPWALTGIVLVLTLAWLTLVAGRTVGYLSPVITNALKNVIATISHETPTRTLFANQGGQEQTDLAERVVALLGIFVLGLGALTGLVLAWRRRPRAPLLVLLAVCTVLYMGTLPLRFVPAAWDTASRAGEFLFLGAGMTVALGANWLLELARSERQPRRWLVALAVTLVFASGVIAGWPGSELLAHARRIVVAGRTLDPPQVVAAAWSGERLGPRQRVFAQPADARLFTVNGRQVGIEGTAALNSSTLNGATIAALRSNGITLVVTDRRKVSDDVLAGYSFDTSPPPLASSAAAAKFDVSHADRIYDAGDIVIYGVRGLW